jgi:hypothetical protein
MVTDCASLVPQAVCDHQLIEENILRQRPELIFVNIKERSPVGIRVNIRRKSASNALYITETAAHRDG